MGVGDDHRRQLCRSGRVERRLPGPDLPAQQPRGVDVHGVRVLEVLHLHDPYVQAEHQLEALGVLVIAPVLVAPAADRLDLHEVAVDDAETGLVDRQPVADPAPGPRRPPRVLLPRLVRPTLGGDRSRRRRGRQLQHRWHREPDGLVRCPGRRGRLPQRLLGGLDGVAGPVRPGPGNLPADVVDQVPQRLPPDLRLHRPPTREPAPLVGRGTLASVLGGGELRQGLGQRLLDGGVLAPRRRRQRPGTDLLDVHGQQPTDITAGLDVVGEVRLRRAGCGQQQLDPRPDAGEHLVHPDTAVPAGVVAVEHHPDVGATEHLGELGRERPAALRVGRRDQPEALRGVYVLLAFD